MCVCVCVHICARVLVCVHACVYMCMHTCVFANVLVFTSLFVCVFLLRVVLMPHVTSSFAKEIHSKTRSLPVVCSLLSVADTTGEWTSNIWGSLGSVTQSSKVDTTVNTDRQVQWLTAPAACQIVQPVLPGDSVTFRSIKAEPVILSDTDIMTILYSKHGVYNHSSDNIDCDIVRDSSSWNSVQIEPIRATDMPKEKTNEPTRATDTPKEKTNEPIRATDAPKEKTNEPTRATDAPKEKIYEPIRATDTPKEKTNEPVRATDAPKEKTNEPIRATDTPKEKTNEPIRATDAPKEKINEPIRATDTPKEKTNEPIRATDTPKEKTNEPVGCTCIQGSSKYGPVVESEGVTETTTIIKREPITDSDSAPTIQPVDDPAVIKTDTAVSLDSWSPREGQERLPSPPQPAHRQVGQTWEVLC